MPPARRLHVAGAAAKQLARAKSGASPKAQGSRALRKSQTGSLIEVHGVSPEKGYRPEGAATPSPPRPSYLDDCAVEGYGYTPEEEALASGDDLALSRQASPEKDDVDCDLDRSFSEATIYPEKEVSQEVDIVDNTPIIYGAVDEPKPHEHLAHDHTGKHHIHTYGVPLGVYTSWIKEELDKEGACLELPLTITLLVAFTIMALLHLRQDSVMILENAITMDITENANFAWAHAFGHKGIEDVNSFADFWSWTRLGLLPLLTAPWGYSEDLSGSTARYPNYDVNALPSHRQFPAHRKAVPVRNDYLRYNRIIGGIRLRQLVAVSSEDKCTFPSEPSGAEVFKSWFGKPCSPSPSGELPPDLSEAEEFGVAERVEWIVTEATDSPAQVLVDMEDGCSSALAQNRTCLCRWCAAQSPPKPWLEEDTTRVEISFIVLNPQLGLYSSAGVNFWFNRAGHIYKLISVRSSWMGIFARPLVQNILLVFADLSWLLLNVYVGFNEVRDIFTILGKSNKVWYHAVAEDYMAFWNLIDWVSIILSLTIFLFGIRLYLVTAVTNDMLADVALETISGNPVENKLLDAVVSFFAAVSDMLEAEGSFRFQMVLYPSVLMLRLFKSFAAQPRLAIVTETFVEARSDIFHFFIVFFSVYVCMAVNAVLFFGQDSVDFATVDRSFHSCFLAMFGDWDYDQMEEIGRYKAAVWFWLFMVIVVLILQNIMLAILMEAYTNVKEATKDSLTLFAQIQKQYRRWRQARQGQRVRLNDIFDALLEIQGGDEEAMLESDDAVFPEELVKKVPNLKAEQAERTLRDSFKDFEKQQNAEPFTTQVMHKNLQSAKSRLDNILVCSKFVESRLCAYHQIEDPTDEHHVVSSDDREMSLSRTMTVENMGKAAPARKDAEQAMGSTATSRGEFVPKPHLDDDHVHGSRKSQLEEGLQKVRKIAATSAVDLSDAMESVLAEEMQALERRQKEQRQSMEQMQASLQSLRQLAYKLSDTCTQVAELSSDLVHEPVEEVVDGVVTAPKNLMLPPPPRITVLPDGTVGMAQ